MKAIALRSGRRYDMQTDLWMWVVDFHPIGSMIISFLPLQILCLKASENVRSRWSNAWNIYNALFPVTRSSAVNSWEGSQFAAGLELLRLHSKIKCCPFPVFCRRKLNTVNIRVGHLLRPLPHIYSRNESVRLRKFLESSSSHQIAWRPMKYLLRKLNLLNWITRT